MKLSHLRKIPQWLLGTVAMIPLNAVGWVLFWRRAPKAAVLVQAVSLVGIGIGLVRAVRWESVRRLLGNGTATKLENLTREGKWRASGLVTAMSSKVSRHDVTAAAWAETAQVPIPLANALDRGLRAPGTGPVLLLASSSVAERVRAHLDPVRSPLVETVEWSAVAEVAPRSHVFRAVVLGPGYAIGAISCADLKLLLWSLAEDAELYTSEGAASPMLADIAERCGMGIGHREAGRCLHLTVARFRHDD